MRQHRFAFDLGSGSLGWAVYELAPSSSGKPRPTKLVDLGVRIFPTGRDPQSRESKASGRRQPRQMRRQLYRRKKRRGEVEGKLVRHGLMPPKSNHEQREAFFAISPYKARSKAAQGEAELYELGRAIWHMSKHRGFKSNRKTDRANEEDSGKIAEGSKQLRQALTDETAATYGDWLAKRHAKGDLVRVRLVGAGAKASYDFYPLRDMLEDEFTRIWNTQAQHHSHLNDAMKEDIRDTVFFQRPLKPVDPGRCTFFPKENRLPRWHPLAQEFLILQALNHLKWTDERGEEHSLSLDTRNVIAKQLMDGVKMTWAGLRRVLKIPSSAIVNIQGDSKKEKQGALKEPPYNLVAWKMENKTRKKGIEIPAPLPRWHTWDAEARMQVLTILDEGIEPEATTKRLIDECGLDQDTAAAVEKISLPEGHLRIGESAAKAIVQELRADVIVYSEAAERAGLHHSDLRPDDAKGLDALPPYNRLETLQSAIGTGTSNPDDPPDKRYGCIANPTVHVGLGQFRRVINALIRRYGKPKQIVIETTRDMAYSAQDIKDHERARAANTQRNDAWRKELEAEGVMEPGAKAGDRFLRMHLWEELGESPAARCCPYTGRPIALHQLHSDQVEIDHILPFAATFDDSRANKTVCFREANREKAGRSPSDAWSGDKLQGIIQRVVAAPNMKKNKKWRFTEGALEHYLDREKRDRDQEKRDPDREKRGFGAGGAPLCRSAV